MRIASSSIHALANADIQRAQRNLFEAQRQAGSERRADDLKGYGRDVPGLLSSRAALERTQAFVQVGKELELRLSTQDLAIGQVAEAAQSARLAVTEAISLDRGDELMAQIESALQTAVGALNIKHAGRYVFSGVADDRAPVTIGTLTELAAAPDADGDGIPDIFADSERTAVVQIDPTSTIDAAPRASEFAGELMALLQRVQTASDTIGPFQGKLTAAQRTELSDILPEFSRVMQDLTTVQATNGAKQARVTSVLDRLNDQETYFNELTADIERVDLAEVASRLSQAQVQLEASAQVYSTLRGSTLLDLLR